MGLGAEALSQVAEAEPESRGGQGEPEPEPEPEPPGRGGGMAGPRQVREAGGEAREGRAL